MIVFAVVVVGVSSGGEEVVVLRVVDGGIAMVIGGTVGVVLPSQSAGVGVGGGGGLGVIWALLAQAPADTILEIVNGWWCCETEHVYV